MKLYNILENGSGLLRSISLDCQEFLEESNDIPLIKWCSPEWPDVHRIKVRKKKHSDKFTEQFNSAFSDIYPSLLNRSIIINKSKPDTINEKFYIFPVDGFKFIHCSKIINSREQLSPTLNEIMEGMGSDLAPEIIQEMLQVTYQESNLNEAIMDDGEIIIYNIPVFYAVKSNMNYKNLLEILKND